MFIISKRVVFPVCAVFVLFMKYMCEAVCVQRLIGMLGYLGSYLMVFISLFATDLYCVTTCYEMNITVVTFGCIAASLAG